MFKFIDRWIDRLEGVRNCDSPPGESLEIIALNLLSAIGEERPAAVLVTSSIPDNTDVSKICEELPGMIPPGIVLECSQNPCLDSKAMRRLPDCSGVVLIEREGRSKHAALARLIECVSDHEKAIYGFVMVN